MQTTGEHTLRQDAGGTSALLTNTSTVGVSEQMYFYTAGLDTNTDCSIFALVEARK